MASPDKARAKLPAISSAPSEKVLVAIVAPVPVSAEETGIMVSTFPVPGGKVWPS